MAASTNRRPRPRPRWGGATYTPHAEAAHFIDYRLARSTRVVIDLLQHRAFGQLDLKHRRCNTVRLRNFLRPEGRKNSADVEDFAILFHAFLRTNDHWLRGVDSAIVRALPVRIRDRDAACLQRPQHKYQWEIR
jgi:hypothetical protein